MEDNLKLEIILVGHKIDITWTKYKKNGDRKYLEKLNLLINNLVKIDKNINKIKADDKNKIEEQPPWKKRKQ